MIEKIQPNGNGKPKKNKMGRPTKFTGPTRRTITEAVSMGSTYDLACKAAGVNYSNFRTWMIRGEREEKGEYRDFWEQVKKAEGLAATSWLRMIEMAASEGNWQAAAWKLERRYPETFGRRTVTVDANINTTETQRIEHQVILRMLEDDQTREIANTLAVRLSGCGESSPENGIPSPDNGTAHL